MSVLVFAAATLVLAALLLAITVIDLRTLRIPDALSLPLIGLGLTLTFIDNRPAFPDHLIGAALGYALFAAIGGWYFRRQGADGLGLGDAKLFAAAGAWLGWQAMPAVLLIAATAGLAFAMTMGKGQRKAAIAFGPWLALGIWAMWLWQNADRLVA